MTLSKVEQAGLPPFLVMAGLVPAIHVVVLRGFWTWMPATSAGMTSVEGMESGGNQSRLELPVLLDGHFPAQGVTMGQGAFGVDRRPRTASARDE